jgi:hypothetical protein
MYIKESQIIYDYLKYYLCMVFLMYQSTKQFHNKQINITVLVFVYYVKHCYMFRHCWVIIRQSLQEYVTRY